MAAGYREVMAALGGREPVEVLDGERDEDEVAADCLARVLAILDQGR